VKSRGAAKDSSAALRLITLEHNPGQRSLPLAFPGLQSDAAPRLGRGLYPDAAPRLGRGYIPELAIAFCIPAAFWRVSSYSN
jgi:hypothetical protein